jgi:hypothetical protein
MKLKSTQSTDPLAPPTLTVEYVIGLVTMLGGLFATQGLITNGTEKLITGLASILVPLAIVGVQAVLKSHAHTAKAKVREAIAANPSPGLSVGDVQEILQAYTTAVSAKIESVVKSPPSASEVAQAIISDAAAKQFSSSGPVPLTGNV